MKHWLLPVHFGLYRIQVFIGKDFSFFGFLLLGAIVRNNFDVIYISNYWIINGFSDF
jgi:hypothetical protein